MLYLIGLGLYDERDLTLRALDVIRNSDHVFMESYTNVYHGDLKKLEEIVGRKIVLLKREDVEEHPEKNILINSKHGNTSFLVPGDPMVATTHIALLLKARDMGIPTKVIHNSSIYSAVGEVGLHIYKFGRTTTIPTPTSMSGYLPPSPYNVLKENIGRGLHTLLLLDISMNISEGMEILLRLEQEKKEGIFSSNTLCIGVARLGGDCDNSCNCPPKIKVGKASDLLKEEFGEPPHSIIVPARLHFMEEEALSIYR